MFGLSLRSSLAGPRATRGLPGLPPATGGGHAAPSLGEAGGGGGTASAFRSEGVESELARRSRQILDEMEALREGRSVQAAGPPLPGSPAEAAAAAPQPLLPADERHVVGESVPVPGMDQALEARLRMRRAREEVRRYGDPRERHAAEADAEAARLLPARPSVREVDPDPEADWDFDFASNARPYRFARGKASRLRVGREALASRALLNTARAQLRGTSRMEVAERDGMVRHVGPTSPFAGLGECGDPVCGAHRLFNPKVRPHFRDFVVSWVEKASEGLLADEDGSLRYASIGSGELLFDLELLERIRARGVHISQICLVDKEYERPSMSVRRALREFADWQRAVAQAERVRPAEIFAFASLEDLVTEVCREECEAEEEILRRTVARSHLLVQVDAVWDGFVKECSGAAEAVLTTGGLLARLNPEPFLGVSSAEASGPLQPVPQPVAGRHSGAAFSVAAWELAPEAAAEANDGAGAEGGAESTAAGAPTEEQRSPATTAPSLLKRLRDFRLEACVAAIAAANAEPKNAEILRAREEAVAQSQVREAIRAKAREKEEKEMQLMAERDAQERAYQEELRAAEAAKEAKEVAKKEAEKRRDEIALARMEAEQEARMQALFQLQAAVREEMAKKPPQAKVQLKGLSVWRVTHSPQVAVREMPRTASKMVGVLYEGEEVYVGQAYGTWLQIAQGPVRATFPPEAWVCFDGREAGYGVMLKQVRAAEEQEEAEEPEPWTAPATLPVDQPPPFNLQMPPVR